MAGREQHDAAHRGPVAVAEHRECVIHGQGAPAGVAAELDRSAARALGHVARRNAHRRGPVLPGDRDQPGRGGPVARQPQGQHVVAQGAIELAQGAHAVGRVREAVEEQRAAARRAVGLELEGAVEVRCARRRIARPAGHEAVEGRERRLRLDRGGAPGGEGVEELVLQTPVGREVEVPARVAGRELALGRVAMPGLERWHGARVQGDPEERSEDQERDAQGQAQREEGQAGGGRALAVHRRGDRAESPGSGPSPGRDLACGGRAAPAAGPVPAGSPDRRWRGRAWRRLPRPCRLPAGSRRPRADRDSVRSSAPQLPQLVLGEPKKPRRRYAAK